MDDQEILDVLVLGAGLSALTAAYEIQKTHSNVKLNLIEAKSELVFLSLIPHILHPPLSLSLCSIPALIGFLSSRKWA